MGRGDLTDAQWKRLRPQLPPQNTTKLGRPPKDHRRILNGLLWLTARGHPGGSSYISLSRAQVRPHSVSAHIELRAVDSADCQTPSADLQSILATAERSSRWAARSLPAPLEARQAT